MSENQSLEWDDLWGPFQPRPFCASVCWSNMSAVVCSPQRGEAMSTRVNLDLFIDFLGKSSFALQTRGDHSHKSSRPGWMAGWASCSGGRLPMARGWNETAFEVSSKPFCDSCRWSSDTASFLDSSCGKSHIFLLTLVFFLIQLCCVELHLFRVCPMTDHLKSPSGQAFEIRVQTKSNQAEINCILLKIGP